MTNYPIYIPALRGNHFRKDFPSCIRTNPFRTPFDSRCEHVKDYNALLTRLGSYPRTLLVKRTTVADSTGLEMVTKPLNCQTNGRIGYPRKLSSRLRYVRRDHHTNTNSCSLETFKHLTILDKQHEPIY